MKPTAVIQARTGSTRLPGKVLASLGRHTVLENVIERCRQSTRLARLAIATTVSPADDSVANLARALGIPVVRGSETDVLARYVQAADELRVEAIVRVTADCPLIDPTVIDQACDRYARSRSDYVCFDGYPNGVGDVEVVRVAALRRAAAETSTAETLYREHVTTYLKAHPEIFVLAIGEAPVPCYRPELRLSVDEPADLEVVRAVVVHFGERLDFTTAEVIAFLDAHPEIVALNRHVRQKTA